MVSSRGRDYEIDTCSEGSLFCRDVSGTIHELTRTNATPLLFSVRYLLDSTARRVFSRPRLKRLSAPVNIVAPAGGFPVDPFTPTLFNVFILGACSAHSVNAPICAPGNVYVFNAGTRATTVRSIQNGYVSARRLEASLRALLSYAPSQNFSRQRRVWTKKSLLTDCVDRLLTYRRIWGYKPPWS
jgi:hypothetical protein